MNSPSLSPPTFSLPRVERPRVIRDGVAWLRMFEHFGRRVEPPMYGVNIWRVAARNLARTSRDMLRLAGPGLSGGWGQLHFARSYPSEAGALTVVMLFRWDALPEDTGGGAPWAIIPAHFSFIARVESYNWTLTKALEPDLDVYASQWNYPFHGPPGRASRRARE